MTISCIVGVYNGEKYLAETLDSILAQSYRPLEVIVVDDGSTDGSADIVRSYGDAVRLVQQENGGVAAARNTGIGVATGELLAFLDADDLWHEEKLTRQEALLRGRPELDFCICHLQNFWVPEMAEEEARFRDHPRSRPIAAYSTVTLLARRALFDRVGLFDTTLPHGECTDWFRRAKEAGAVGATLDEVLTRRRLHPDNRSRRLADDSREHYLRYLKALADRKRSPGT